MITNPMVDQEEHAYSEHSRPSHSAKFNSRRDNPWGEAVMSRLDFVTPQFRANCWRKRSN